MVLIIGGVGVTVVGVVVKLLWHGGIVCSKLELVNGKGKGKVSVLPRAVEPPAYLWAV